MAMLPATPFGAWLKERRQALDLTQTALAEQVLCSANLIQKIEAGTRRPSRQLAELLAQALGIAPDEQGAFVAWARGVAGAPPATVGVAPITAPSTSLPTAAAGSIPLPIPPTAFVGRAAEVAQVRILLWRPTVRLLTLTGPPGIGKTRLALEVAAQVRDDFADGVGFVPLAPLADPALVAGALADGLGIVPAPGQSLPAGLQDYLRARQMLLVLDNFEQVTAAAPLVADLLGAAPHLKILVTSRAALRLRGEKEVPVPPLGVPGATDLPAPEALARLEAVALFVERAQDVQPEFTLTAANAGAVAAICRRLEGVPLAIELAAARSKLLVPAALLARLEDRLALLTGGPRDLPARQQTLHAAITWSYDLLAPAQQALFRRLGAFMGGCPLAAVEAVCADCGFSILDFGSGNQSTPKSKIENPQFDVLTGLAALVDQSLIWQVAEAAEPRFAMLEIIREYAAVQLDRSGEAGAVRRVHARFFLDLAERLRLQLMGLEQRAALARLDQEQDNIRAALRWALDAGDAEIALRLATAMGRFWYVRAHLVEGRRWIEAALAGSAGLPPRLRARAFTQASNLALVQSDFAAAHDLAHESLRLWWEVDDPTPDDKGQIASSYSNLGVSAAEQGDPAHAQAHLEQNLAIWRELNDLGNQAVTLSNLGFLALYQHDYAQAVALCEECLVIQRELNNTVLLPPAMINLGLARLHQGDVAAAQALYAEALTQARELGDRRNQALALNYLGLAALAADDVPGAAEAYQASLRLARDLGNRFAVARVLAGLAAVAGAQGQFGRAARLCAAAQAHLDSITARLTPAERAWYERTLAAAQAGLGEAGFAAAQALGRALPIEDVLAFALEPA